MKKVAVVLSGCGHRDGSEITEAVSTLLALSEKKITYQIFAPQVSVKAIDHVTGQASAEMREARAEAGRIARGQVQPLEELRPKDFDAIIFPGGFGAATVLCKWADSGPNCEVLPDVERVIREFYADDKPIGAICIAPALIARVLGNEGITVTVGENGPTAKAIEKTGAHHVVCAVNDYITDREHKIVTTPAYMYDADPFSVYTGIRGLVGEISEMA